MANAIQRSISDKGRRALRRFTPSVCEQAHRMLGTASEYEVAGLLGIAPRQARSAGDAWQEVQVVARVLDVKPSVVVAEIMQGVE